MSRESNAHRQAALWLERIAWNAAAGAVLAVMILALLGSLEWLDTLSNRASARPPVVSPEAASLRARITGEAAECAVDPATAPRARRAAG